MRNRILSTVNRVRPGLLFALLLFIASVYLTTYSARIETGDTLRIYDAASSVGRFGDTDRDESLWQEPPSIFWQDEAYSLNPYEPGEEMMIRFVAVFFAIAALIPGIGLVHATWLFNIVITVSLVGCWYLVARTLGFERRVALVTMVLLALATGLWVYSKTLFREPFVGLLLLLITLCLLRWRHSQYRQVLWLVGAALLMIILYWSRNSSVMALPALVGLVLPLPGGDRRGKLADLALLVALVVALLLILMPDLLAFLRAYLPVRLQSPYVQIALQSYLISPGASLFGTSPVLLLAIPGAVLFLRRERRMVWVVVLLVGAYAFGHAFLTDRHWFGGLSWPPRFLMPVLPFVMLLTLPAIGYLLERRIIWLRVLAGGVIAYSLAIQIVAAISFQDAYPTLLPADSGGLLEWSGGYNDPAFFRWVLLPQTWSSIGFDVAWRASGADAVPWLLLALGGAAVIMNLRFRARYTPVVNAVCAAGVLLITFVGLRWLYDHDPRYWAGNVALNSVLDHLAAETNGIEPLVLADTTYDRFIMNYNRLTTVRPLVLGIQPGEAVSDRVPARITSDYVPELLDRYALRLLDHLAGQHDRIWLLAHNSEYLPWSIRPVERYLATHYYPLTAFVTDDPAVRLLSFATATAPVEFRLPENRTDLRFGEAITLDGLTLPYGMRYRAGDIVAVTFFWRTAETLAEDYVVAWFMVAEDQSRILQGTDTMPAWGFAPTSAWVPDTPILDNHALQLPEDLAPGRYRMWVVLYPRSSGGSIRLPVAGNEVMEGTIGVLPITLEVEDAP